MKAELAALADEVDLVADEIWRVGHTASHRLNLVRYERTVLLLATLGDLAYNPRSRRLQDGGERVR